MLIRQQFSRLTSPCLIIVFFLYPEYQATVKEDKHWFYIYSLSMLWNHITYWNRAIKEASTCHLLFARHGNAPCSVIDEVWGNPSTITSVIGSWYWDGGNTDAVKSLPLLLWILSSNYPDLTIHLWQRSHVTPEALEIMPMRGRLQRSATPHGFKRVCLCKQWKGACLVLCSNLPN